MPEVDLLSWPAVEEARKACAAAAERVAQARHQVRVAPRGELGLRRGRLTAAIAEELAAEVALDRILAEARH